MPRFAANLTMMFNEYQFLDRFQAAAAAGFQAAEFLFPYDFPAETVAEHLKEAGLEQALFNMPPGDWSRGDRGLAALSARTDEFRLSIEKGVSYARIIGAPLLHVMAGNADNRDRVSNDAYRDAVKRVTEAAGASGIGVVIEPINGRDMPGYFLDSFERAADLIAALDLPNLKLQFDIYHRQVMRGDVLTALEKMMPIIGHVQVASVPKRNEPGTGELDDFRIFAALDALGYRGYVGCEYRPATNTVAGLGWLAEVGTAGR
jgi:2-dehydrotetronate isomerase